jgi:small conductance mechanosensitive channel
MSRDWKWKDTILEPPQLLGVDDFGDRGIVIKVWIKTQPLKQWDVAREYRRRLKNAFDLAGIIIPVRQQEIHFQAPVSVSGTKDEVKIPGGVWEDR